MFVMSINSKGIQSHKRYHNPAKSNARKIRLRLLSFIAAALFFLLLLSVTLVRIDAQGVKPDPALPGEQIVVVTAGDTLWSIAKDSGLDGGIQEIIFKIKERNGLKNSVIEPGQQIIVPRN
ncbi:LysM peptidoglycan-binding domain-containing protein [Paenibacillus beijingensis]|uniref:LysM domain-containing protein n=1 Tax=Paenibacillus beijingensis TaxID=1126833 RepID=A0A0D5NP22_9BACL|nr:LysM peptidoglycan-binding domain-containing protein [Paenibacillus beijingensis]AJY77074.1 hypothetical protein VN24_24145 [Paenibacillus beijingensis]